MWRAKSQGLDLPPACVCPAKCRYALGMQDRTIPDSDISVSSSWSDSTAARHSRYLGWESPASTCPLGLCTYSAVLRGSLPLEPLQLHRSLSCSQAGEQRRGWGMVSRRACVPQGGRVPAGGPAAPAPGGPGGHSGTPRWWPGQGVLPQLPAALLPGRPPLDGLEGPLGPGGEAAGAAASGGASSTPFKLH